MQPMKIIVAIQFRMVHGLAQHYINLLILQTLHGMTAQQAIHMEYLILNWYGNMKLCFGVAIGLKFI